MLLCFSFLLTQSLQFLNSFLFEFVFYLNSLFSNSIPSISGSRFDASFICLQLLNERNWVAWTFHGIKVLISVTLGLWFSTNDFQSLFLLRGVHWNSFFLHHFVNQGQIRFQHFSMDMIGPPGKCDDYRTICQNTVGLVDGTLPKPMSYSLDHEVRVHCNHMVLSWLFKSL